VKTIAGTEPSKRNRVEVRPIGSDSPLWETTGNTLYLAAIGGAFMLQGMHPMIAAASQVHSAYKTDLPGRLIRSFDSIMLWVYGGEEALAEGRRLRRLHAEMQGVDDHGFRYNGVDPEAWAWVWATAWVVGPRVYELMLRRPLTETELDERYAATLELGRVLRVPEQYLFPTRAQFDVYAEQVLARLERTPIAEDAVEILTESSMASRVAAPLRPIVRPLDRATSRTMYLLTVGTMPESARRTMGLTWTDKDERALRRLFSVAVPIHDRLPERLRYTPLARHSRRRARALNRIKSRMRTSFVD
jgi:uncharacterized protein (DUF2236 family)